MVGKRRNLLTYLRNKDINRYAYINRAFRITSLICKNLLMKVLFLYFITYEVLINHLKNVYNKSDV